jgi:hypothetical protein
VLTFGACDEAFVRRVRPARDDEPLDPGWYPLDSGAPPRFEAPGRPERPWPDDHTVLYWWRPTFWRLDG